MTQKTPEQALTLFDEGRDSYQPTGWIGYSFLPEHIETIRQSLSARQWMPIESAPESNGSKDFLAYVIGHGCVVCHKRNDGLIYRNSSPYPQITMATHWKPLDAPPSGGEGKL